MISCMSLAFRSGNYQRRARLLRVFATSHRRSIVTQIGPTTSILRSDNSDNEVYLLGTAHISKASADEAIQLIEVVQPEKVFIELDPPRAARLRATQGTTEGPKEEEDQFEQAMNIAAQQLTKSGISLPTTGFGGGGGDGQNVFRDGIHSFYKMLRGYGYVPGIEMLAAMNAADQIGAELVYGDRDVNDTLREIKASFSPSLLMKLMTAPPPSPKLQSLMMEISTGGVEGLGETTELIKTRENAGMISSYMDKAVPDIANVLIHRRDKVMAENLKRHCGAGKVVAVVGLAHMAGIEREWQKL